MLRRVISDCPAGESEALRDGSGEGNAEQGSVSTPPNGSAEPSPNDRKRHWLTEFLRAALDQQTTQIRAWLAEVSNRPPETESYLRIVAECQKEAATFANHVLERHALYPAVETVDFLTGVIRQLSEQAAALAAAQTHCPLFQPLLDAIAAAAQAAQAKCEYLDLEAICPPPLEDLDPEKHEIRQAVPTDDAGQHRRVERTLLPGLIYRGTVLRRAKVSVYRHTEKGQ